MTVEQKKIVKYLGYALLTTPPVTLASGMVLSFAYLLLDSLFTSKYDAVILVSAAYIGSFLYFIYKDSK